MSLPNAATLRALAEPLSRASLKRGVLDAVASRGTGEIIDLLEFGVSEGKSYDYNIKSKNPTGSAARNPRSRQRPSTGGVKRVNVQLQPKELSRDAETALIDMNALSDEVSQQDQNIYDEGAALYEEMFTYLFHGTGGVDVPMGIDGHLDLLGGSYFGNAYDDTGPSVVSDARGQKVFATDTGLPGGVRQSLEVGMIDDAISLLKGGRKRARIVSNRRTWIDFKKSLNLSGGNTTTSLVDGVQMQGYDGMEWVISDNAFGKKESFGGGSTNGTTLTIENTDDGVLVDTWIGFSDADQGRDIVILGAGAAGADLTTTIASVTSRDEVELTDAAGTAVVGAYVMVEPTNGLYVTRFDKANGIAAVVPSGDATSLQKYDEANQEYYGAMAGLNVLNLGISPLAGNLHVDRLVWQGNFALHSPHAAVRITHFDLTN